MREFYYSSKDCFLGKITQRRTDFAKIKNLKIIDISLYFGTRQAIIDGGWGVIRAANSRFVTNNKFRKNWKDTSRKEWDWKKITIKNRRDRQFWVNLLGGKWKF